MEAIQFINTTPQELTEAVRAVFQEELSRFTLPDPEKPLKYQTRKEAARVLKISLPTLDEYTRTGIIKGRRMGTRILYLEEDIMKAVKEIPNRRRSK